MNTVLQAPTWATTSTNPGTTEGALRQLVNAAGPLANGMAVALNLVQRAQAAEEHGQTPFLDPTQRAQLIAMCAVAAQMLGECANDACDTLILNGTD